MADSAQAKPWEMDWSGGAQGATPAPAAAPAASGSAKPWEMDWSGGAQAPQQSAPSPGMGEGAVAQGFGQGASLGYLPQLQAAASKPIYAVLNAITGQNAQPDSYVQERDANIARLDALKKENPYAYHAAQAAGMIATAAAPGAALEGTLAKAGAAGLPGATAAAQGIAGLSKAKSLALGGGAIGALQNPGDTAGVVDPVQGVDRAENGAIGLATGYGLSKLPGIAGSVGTGVKKVVSAVSGIPEHSIDRYLSNSKDIDALAKNYGDHIAEATDAIKQKWNGAISSKLATLNQQKQAVLNAAGDVKVSAQPIFDALSSAQQNINQKLYPEAHAGIDALKAKIMSSLGGTEGSPAQLEEIKSFLQGEAQSSYQKGGQMFSGGDKLDKAAKTAAAIARKQVNAAVPEVAGVNNQFQLLYNLQDTMNRNMLKVGQSEASVVAAGANTSSRNAKALSKLGDLVGEDMTGDAQNIAALKYFGNPGILSGHSTGKALLGMAIGGATHGPLGSVAGLVASSPAAIKAGLKAASLAGGGASALGGAASEAIPQALREAVSEAAPAAANAASEASQGVREVFGGSSRPAFNPPASAPASADQKPAKGPDKWANDGLDKLEDHDDSAQLDRSKLLADPKARQLLIAASVHKPGSPAMKDIAKKLGALYGNASS